LAELLPLIGIVIAGGVVQGITGFGFGLFSMGLMIMFMPVTEATSIIAILSLGAACLNLWTVRKEIIWREALPLIVPAIPACVLGVYLLTSLNTDVLRTGVAVMILAGCAVTIWSPKGVRISKANPWAYVAGVIGGVFNGALGMGGPPIVLYTLLRGWEKALSKGAMSSFFVSMGVIRITLLIARGIATPHTLRMGMLLLGPALLACYVGTRVFRRLSTTVFRYAAMALLAGLAAKILLT